MSDKKDLLENCLSLFELNRIDVNNLNKYL